MGSSEEISRLRRISVSPWADRKDMARKLENRYIFSMKPNLAYLAVPHLDEDFIRQELRKDLEITRDCIVEVIMKDNNTIGHNPQNVICWCKIAQEEAEGSAGKLLFNKIQESFPFFFRDFLSFYSYAVAGQENDLMDRGGVIAAPPRNM